MSVEIQPYFAEGERYPALIGVRAEGDEYETAYVNKSELVDALAENAKLRELVADTLMHPREYCEKHGIEYEGWDSVDAHIYARMRELGVEIGQ